MRKVTKKIISLGLVAALVVAGAATSTVSVDAKGKGKGNTETSTDSQKKDQKDKKGKKSKKDKKKQDICTGAAVTTTGGAVNKKCGKSKKKKVIIEEVTAICTKAGKVKVLFPGEVEWAEEVTVEVKDAEENTLPAELKKNTKDMAVVAVSDMVVDSSYTITISGVKQQDETEFSSVSCDFVVEKLKSKCKAYKIKKKIAVKEENTIVIKCKNKVMLKDAAVEVTDEDGDIYEAEITGKKKGNIKVTVSGLEEGEEYTITVTGVKTKKENNYGSVTTAFATKK